MLIPRNCEIDLSHMEGSISFQGMAPITTSWGEAPAYQWLGGLKDYSRHDPVAVAERVYDYVSDFAGSLAAAKSKPDIAVATGVDYRLCCEVIDEFTGGGYFIGPDTKDLYYFSAKVTLPPKGDERWRALVELCSPIPKRLVLVKAHFRVFYYVLWMQISAEDKDRAKRKENLERLRWFLTILGVVLGLTGLLLRLFSR